MKQYVMESDSKAHALKALADAQFSLATARMALFYDEGWDATCSDLREKITAMEAELRTLFMKIRSLASAA